MKWLGALGVALCLAGCCNNFLICGPHYLWFSFRNDCVNPAKSLRFTVQDPTGQINLERVMWEAFDSYTVGEPTVEHLGDEYRVTFELADLPIANSVTTRISYSAPEAVVGAEIVPTNVQFYAAPPESIGVTPPPCPPSAGPGLRAVNDPSMGFAVEVFSTADVAMGPVIVDMLQWALIPEGTFPPDHLVWDDPVLESVPWVDASNSYPILLYSGGAPFVFDVPDALLVASGAVLLRYSVSSPYTGQRMIWEGVIGGSIKTESTTWGKLKTIYE